MKNNKNITVLILVVIIAWAGFLYFKKAEAPTEEIVQDNTEVVENTNKIQMCFIYNTEAGDKASIIMNINGDDVDGEFNWVPAEKDSKTGKFSGAISPVDPYMMARTLDVIWDASAEGTLVKEQLKIIMGEGNASPGFGEMKDRGDGVYVYTDPENINYSLNLSLTSCDDEFLTIQ